MADNLTLVNPENIEKKASSSWEKMALLTINSCPKIKKEREKLILIDRFGIGKSPKTLNAVGEAHNVTRERIRQIVNNALKKIRKYGNLNDINKNLIRIEKFIDENGGFVTSIELYKQFAPHGTSEQNSLRFITSLSENIDFVKDSNTLSQGWIKKGLKEAKLKENSKKIVAALKERGKTLSAKEVAEAIGEEEGITKASLSATKAVMKGDDNKWGLKSWPHLNPRSIKEKSKYIMVRHNKPIHYEKLTQLISEMSIRTVTKQSVHNELIKNQEFVLVGRGIYALSDWGYKPGVVEEVIVEVMIGAGKPLHKNEIIDRVLEKRIVKASTVILNLQKKRFKRVGKATYTLNS